MKSDDKSNHTKRAAADLRQWIISGEVAGGSRLREIAVAEKLNISRTPVREAMARLAEEGLLERVGTGGFVVRAFTLRDAVDAIGICASTDTHVRLIELAAQAGKPVFCEKPLSLDLGDIDRLEALTEAHGVPLQVGFNRRFDPSHRSVWRAVREGAVGEPHLIRITSRDPEPPPIEYSRVSGGLFLDMTSHDFDMARFVAGSEVTEVFARGAARVDPAIAELGDVDTAVSALSHENGCMTLIDNSRRASYGYDQRVEVFGSEGMARSDNHPLHSGEVLTGSGRAEPVLRPFFLDRYRESYRLGWESFIAAAAGRGRVAVGAEDARRALMIGIAATESMRNGAAVKVETAR